MPRHWLLPRRLPFIFLNQHHSLPPRTTFICARTRRTKEDNELLHRRNQPLVGRNYRFEDDPGVSMRARVSCVSLYVFKNIPVWRSPTKGETTSSKMILPCLCHVRMYLCIRKDLCPRSAEQVQLTRLFRTEQGALSRESLVPAVFDGGIIARGVPGT